MLRNGFIMPDGTEFEVDEMSHEAFAQMLLRRKGWLQTQKSATDTLVVSHGAVKVGGILGTKVITVYIRPCFTTNRTWEIVDYYRDKGYIVDVIQKYFP